MKAVGIDVDGVLANFKKSFIDWFGLTIKPHEVSHWDIFSFMSEDDAKLAKRELSHPDFWRNMEAYPYARNLVETFSSRGVQVVIVTSPWRSCSEWDEVRRQWVYKFVGDFPVITAADKRYTNVQALLDDKPSHIVEFNEYNRGSGNYAYLIDRPYNRNEDLTRISLEKHYERNSWEDLFCEIIKDRAQKAYMF